MIRRWLGLLDAERESPALRRAPERSSPAVLSRRELLFPLERMRRRSGRWKVTIDSTRCSSCEACVRICRAGALRSEPEGDRVVYRLEASRCDGCADCARVCAAGALHVSQVENAPAPEIVVRLERRPCRVCGQAQFGLIDGRCPPCRTTRLADVSEGVRLR